MRIRSLKILSVVASSVLGVAVGHADTWTVREYGGESAWTSEDGVPHPCGCVTVVGGDVKEITITANPDQELKFEIYWADAGGGYIDEAPLNDLTIDQAVDAELIEITIARDPAASDPEHKGASDIAQMNIAPGNFDECRLKGLTISANLATTADVLCDNISGNLDIGGNLGKIGLPYTTLSAGTVAGTITINGTLVSGDSIEVGTLGDLTIYGSGATPVQGDITITNSYAGTLLIDHKFGGEIDLGSALTGTISITGVTTGVVNVDGNVSGAILVDANLNKPGRIVIGGSVSQANATVPAVRITAGVVGSIVLEKCSGLRTRRTLRPGALCD
jgi:hypothetical protein